MSALYKLNKSPASIKPLYPGDLINNIACYTPEPNFSNKEWKIPQMRAEGFSFAGSILNADRKEKRMVYCSMSGGYFGYEKAEQYEQKVKEASRRFMKPGDGDTEFLTIQKLSGALGGDILGNDIFARNGLKNQQAVEWMSRNTMQGKVIVGPDDREGHLRSLHQKHAHLQGIPIEDAIFEIGIWGPEVLIEHSGGVYYGDHAWSRNGANEKAVGLAIQYGSKIPLDLRDGRSFDNVDIMDRPVSVVDQAWEDARHIVDVVERGFRSETAVALMISRFMHDRMWQENSSNLDKSLANVTVQTHYADPSEMERMEQLKSLIVPYIAEKCNWPTLHRILDNDPDLKATWENDILPQASKLGKVSQLEIDILSYLPRGGFDGGKLKAKIENRKDPVEHRVSLGIQSTTPRPLASHFDPFDSKFDAKIFNDRDHARLGNMTNPNFTPDNDHLVFDQTAAESIVFASEKDRRPAGANSATFFYLDDAAGGIVGAKLEQKTGIKDTRGFKTLSDPFANGAQPFTEVAAKEHLEQMGVSKTAIMESDNCAEFRESHQLGQIIRLSDIKLIGQEFKKPKELPNGDTAYYRDGHASMGADTMSSPAVKAAAKRIVGLSCQGVVMNPGKTTPTEARILSEAMNVAMGQVDRPYEGGKFDMKFFMNNDYMLPAEQQSAPTQMDLGDVILHIGRQVKANLESKNPENMNDLNILLMRLLEYYEMSADPGRRNIILERDPKTGADVVKNIVDHTKVSPELIMSLLEHEPGSTTIEDLDVHMVGQNPTLDAFLSNPAFQNFAKPESQKTPAELNAYKDDPSVKVREVQQMWAWMRAMPVFTADAKTGNSVSLPVTGMLTTLGMAYADDYDLCDAHEDYRSGRDAMRNLTERQRKNVFGSGQIHIDGPQIAVN